VATKAEKQWMDAITRMGCVVCYMRGYPGTPAVPHHLLDDGGRRIGHLSTIPLCDPGHHQNAPANSGKISRHPNKARFEAAYGTEEELLAETRAIVLRQAQPIGARLWRDPYRDRPDLDMSTSGMPLKPGREQ
jgi:hypothetical protein